MNNLKYKDVKWVTHKKHNEQVKALLDEIDRLKDENIALKMRLNRIRKADQ